MPDLVRCPWLIARPGRLRTVGPQARRYFIGLQTTFAIAVDVAIERYPLSKGRHTRGVPACGALRSAPRATDGNSRDRIGSRCW